MYIEGNEYPNLNKGYKTTVTMPFEISKRGNNTINIWDAGNYYDQYVCRGSMFCTETQMDGLYKIYNNQYDVSTAPTGRRGQSVTLTQCVETGFYPFTPAVDETSYLVWIDDIKNKGMVDEIGKIFEVEISFLWEFPTSGGANTISWNNPLATCNEGSLDFANLTDIRYPIDGFKIKKGHDVAVQNYKGSQFYGVNFDVEDTEWNEAEFELTLRQNMSSNLLYNLLNTYRGNTILIEGGDNYYIFGEDKGNVQFSVKMSNNEIEVVHQDHQTFNISLKVVKV